LRSSDLVVVVPGKTRKTDPARDRIPLHGSPDRQVLRSFL